VAIGEPTIAEPAGAVILRIHHWVVEENGKPETGSGKPDMNNE
jgi:hypothetical protein